jgi:glycine betaine/proline transport system ATP-binding protein
MQDEFLRLQKLLRKTIAFITHDFDEAIRLADRIAIMKDGAIVQIGTPEEVVTRPATPYVAEFTREVPRAKVLSVGAVMGPIDGATEFAGELPATAKVAEVAKTVLGRRGPFLVVGEDGQRVGALTQERVIAVLAGTGGA